MISTDSSKVRAFYNAFAPVYDWEAIMAGFSENSRWRQLAIDTLKLNSDSTVLDIACGTGLNFKLITSHLGEDGKLVGVDLSPRMLKIAERRIERRQWRNVEVVNANIIDYQPDGLFDAAICTLAMETMPNYKAIVDHIFSILKPQGRFAMLGASPSSRTPHKLLNGLYAWFCKTGGLDIERSVKAYIETKTDEFEYESIWGGFSYMLSVSMAAIRGQVPG